MGRQNLMDIGLGDRYLHSLSLRGGEALANTIGRKAEGQREPLC